MPDLTQGKTLPLSAQDLANLERRIRYDESNLAFLWQRAYRYGPLTRAELEEKRATHAALRAAKQLRAAHWKALKKGAH